MIPAHQRWIRVVRGPCLGSSNYTVAVTQVPPIYGPLDRLEAGSGTGASGPRSARRLVADLHLHSRFSIGTSRYLDLAALAKAARGKGIDLLATGDFTHPEWLTELRAARVEADDGMYEAAGVRFVLGTEVSCVWQ